MNSKLVVILWHRWFNDRKIQITLLSLFPSMISRCIKSSIDWHLCSIFILLSTHSIFVLTVKWNSGFLTGPLYTRWTGVTICDGIVFDLSPTCSDLSVWPRLSTPSADTGPLVASPWVDLDKKLSIIGKGSSTCWVCFTCSLMDSRLCVHVWTSASLRHWPSGTETRDHHAPCLGTGWAPAHMPLVVGAQETRCKGRQLPRRAQQAQ